jgi:hypothetical protein
MTKQKIAKSKIFGKTIYQRAVVKGKYAPLISIPTSKIGKMTKSQILNQMQKGEYEKVHTAKTWNALDTRLMELSKGR